MLRIRIRRGSDGTIRWLEAEGHALKDEDPSLPCGIASALLRSFGRWALGQDGIRCRGNAPGPGVFLLELEPTGDSAGILLGSSGLLIAALRDLSLEAEREIELSIE